MTQVADTRAGFYYVTAIDAGRVALLLGPFTRHADALARVDEARRDAERVDARAVFAAFGTCRSENDLGAGKLNTRLGVAA